MNAWAFAAIQNVCLMVLCGLIIWFHHEWYWIIGSLAAYGMLAVEIRTIK